MKTIQIIIKGKVQGVYYRASAIREASSLGINGWVRNLDNGDVEICASGGDAALKKLIQWCYRGPGRARVEEVIYRELPFEDFDGFEKR